MRIVYPNTTLGERVLLSVATLLTPRLSEVLAAFLGGFIFALHEVQPHLVDSYSSKLAPFNTQLAAFFLSWGIAGIFFGLIRLIDQEKNEFDLKPEIKIYGVELPRFFLYASLIIYSVYLFKIH